MGVSCFVEGVGALFPGEVCAEVFEDIAEVVAAWTGIPLTQMMETESVKLLQMEEKMNISEPFGFQ